MTTEAIARVVNDLRNGRVMSITDDKPLGTYSDEFLAVMTDEHTPVVDATAIYRSLLKRDGVRMYEDHNIMPVFDTSLIAYVNEHGNVVVSATMTYATEPGEVRWENASAECDWDRVTHVSVAVVYCGGYSATEQRSVPTMGPMHAWRIATYDDGEIADLHWHQILADKPLENWDMAAMVLLGTLTFFGARNVELAEPIRSRGERKRIARAAPGITVKELVVFPAGTSTRSRGGGIASGGTPLTSVRGHWAKYGPEYGRGLLFGKIAGRFWIPSHARGDAEHGESQHNYRIST